MAVRFADLPRASRQAVDIVAVQLAPIFARLEDPVQADGWKRYVLVLVARAMSVSGSTVAALTLRGAAIDSAIARVLSLCSPDVAHAAELLRAAVAEAQQLHALDPEPPSVWTPARTPSPSPSPVPPTAPSAPTPDPALLSAIAAMGQSIGAEIARAFSASFASPPPASPSAVDQTLLRHMEEQKSYSSAACPALDDPHRSLLLRLPVDFRWPKDHADAPLFRRSLVALAKGYARAEALGAPAFIAACGLELKAANRNICIGRAAELQALSFAPGNSPAVLLSLAELAVEADKTLAPTALEILRLARVARPTTTAEVAAARRGEYVSVVSVLDALPVAEPRQPPRQPPRNSQPQQPTPQQAPTNGARQPRVSQQS
jgi:hypothetical protein